MIILFKNFIQCLKEEAALKKMKIVTQKFAEVFNVLNKFESESDEKEKKFWDDIAELKIPLGDIFEGSK